LRLKAERAGSNAEIVNGSFTPVKQSERLEGVKQKTRNQTYDRGRQSQLDKAEKLINEI